MRILHPNVLAQSDTYAWEENADGKELFGLWQCIL